MHLFAVRFVIITCITNNRTQGKMRSEPAPTWLPARLILLLACFGFVWTEKQGGVSLLHLWTFQARDESSCVCHCCCVTFCIGRRATMWFALSLSLSLLLVWDCHDFKLQLSDMVVVALVVTVIVGIACGCCSSGMNLFCICIEEECYQYTL